MTISGKDHERTMLKKQMKHIGRRISAAASSWGTEVSAVAAGERTGEIELVLATAPNYDWSASNRGSRITFTRQPLIDKAAKVFAMGSCFAVEIRRALHDRGFDVYPKYDDIVFDPATQKLGKLPARDNINHYDTFTIRQEFELAFAGGHYSPKDFVAVPSGSKSPFVNPGLEVWQDPYRKRIYAVSPQAIADLSAKIDNCIHQAIHDADLYVVTLGLTEVWRNDKNGRYICQAPGKNIVGNRDGFTFECSTYAQNLENVLRVCRLVKDRFPRRKIILTVSPVPLSRTYSGKDIVVANMESKCTLRAVAAEATKLCDNAVYWPSFEIALARDIFEADGRHVRPDGINLIVSEFLKVHLHE
jgi:hypothetical protein